ncbi:DJ-1/PfpI family protein [Phenylobacterium aquaticum]|uniref:DJ-1/PfpI family protein n=1 Tax=Phenylobacterium aquaticum TaxID=1763816 RepID=UPI001F5C305E|nr:DJ-1/PfpI family protein [Phenylobacterium aquaticum]MCI3131836.1 DJ-1/PfpI family protein [Phenylobacterium aquaticum]
MPHINRRVLAMAALAAPLAGQPAGADPVPAPRRPDFKSWSRPDQIAMLVYPRMTALDLIAPQHMFASLMGAHVHLVAKNLAPVTSDTGVTITPTTTFKDCPRDLTVLFAPGGTDGTLAAMADDETRAFMADRGARATYVTSVCTGALILGAAGLLNGYRATTHWAARDVLPSFGATLAEGRVVRDRNRVTGAGVTAGLDFGLAMIAELRDRFYAEGVQLQAEYDPHPPFNAGALATAPADVRAVIEPMQAGFLKRAQALADRLRSA